MPSTQLAGLTWLRRTRASLSLHRRLAFMAAVAYSFTGKLRATWKALEDHAQNFHNVSLPDKSQASPDSTWERIQKGTNSAPWFLNIPGS